MSEKRYALWTTLQNTRKYVGNYANLRLSTGYRTCVWLKHGYPCIR